MICKDCQLPITDFVICKDRGKERIRTRCRPCWNKYSRKVQENHSDYYKEYLKKYFKVYTKERRKFDMEFKELSNRHNLKSNLKAQAELKDSYVKNRIANGKKFLYTKEMIEIKRMQMQLSREIKRLDTASK